MVAAGGDAAEGKRMKEEGKSEETALRAF